MRCHPDRNPQSGAHDAFVTLSAAYRVLADDARRAAYDRQAVIRARHAVGFEHGVRDARVRTRDVQPNTSQRSRSRQESVRNGATVAASPPPRTLHLTRAELADGCRRVLDFAWIAACDACSGSGMEAGDGGGCRPCAGTGRSFATGYSARCPTCAGTGDPLPRKCVGCGGTGRTPRREQVVVAVPAGSAAGSLLTLRDGRPDPLRPGLRCDLTLRIELDPEELAGA